MPKSKRPANSKPPEATYNEDLDREFNFGSCNQSPIYELQNYETIARMFGATAVETALRNLRIAYYYALSQEEVQRVAGKLLRPIHDWRPSEFKGAKIPKIDVKAACEEAKLVLSPYMSPREMGSQVWDYLLEDLPAELARIREEEARRKKVQEELDRNHEASERYRARQRELYPPRERPWGERDETFEELKRRVEENRKPVFEGVDAAWNEALWQDRNHR